MASLCLGLCLTWKQHESNLLDQLLLHAETFTDVTLAVEGQYLKAHKIVLSAYSPFFKALFVNHTEMYPFVILEDVPYLDMKSLLDFMYRGEVCVDQERLAAFLRLADSLRIKGLMPSPEAATAAGAGAAGSGSTPTLPQLQSISPYLVPQRNRSQAGGPLASPANAGKIATPTLPLQPSPAPSSSLKPKRKGRTAYRVNDSQLSGSSNGTGNDDYDDFDRENLMHDTSDLGNGKLGNDSYSGYDDSYDNCVVIDTAADTETDTDHLNKSCDSRSKKSKDHRAVSQHEDNGTSGESSLPVHSQIPVHKDKIDYVEPASAARSRNGGHQQQTTPTHQQQQRTPSSQQYNGAIY